MTIDSREAMRLLRERLIANDEKKTFSDAPRTSSGDNARYPFWNMKDDETCTIRLLPDHADAQNPWFWVAREVIRLPFAGVVGGDYPTDRNVTVEVPCVDMFAPYVSGMACPIIQATKPWWKDEAKKDLARTYYKKKSWLFQGFVVNSPFEEAEVPENPIRRFVISKSIFDIIKASLIDPEMEDYPVDYQNGTDFRITRKKQGEYANYSQSSWSRRARGLSENELIAIEQHGLWNLKDFLGRIPDADELAAIKAMFNESIAGQPFDFTSYGQYYRAFTDRDGDGSEGVVTKAARVEAAREVVRQAPVTQAPSTAAETVTAPAASGSKPDAKDILARIRDRTANR